jgi:hypothetical protein
MAGASHLPQSADVGLTQMRVLGQSSLSRQRFVREYESRAKIAGGFLLSISSRLKASLKASDDDQS